MRAADLPAPTTIVRPRGGDGRWRAKTRRGSALAIAASNIARSARRAVVSVQSVSVMSVSSAAHYADDEAVDPGAGVANVLGRGDA